MRKTWYYVSCVLLFLPYCIGWAIGYVWRAVKAGMYAGFGCIQHQIEDDFNKQVTEKLMENNFE